MTLRAWRATAPGPTAPASYDDVWIDADRLVGVRDHGDLRPGARVLVWAHGGSWVGGCVEDWHPALSHLASRLGDVVVGVRYRLASQTHHPAPSDDVSVAVRAARRLVGDGGKVVVGGDSAGGTLAAAAALRVPAALDGQVLLFSDPMREESMAYAERLRAAGATVRIHVLAGVHHGDFLRLDPARRRAPLHDVVEHEARHWFEADR